MTTPGVSSTTMSTPVGLFEGADVAAFAADDAAFHGVVFDLDGVGGGLGGVVRRRSVGWASRRIFLGGFFGVFLCFFLGGFDDLAGLGLALLLEQGEGFAFGVVFAEVGESEELVFSCSRRACLHPRGAG